jgi:predicted  nucleic acid-binding Zn-ribbon protein
VPVKPKALGALSLASAESGERDEEFAAAVRSAKRRRLGLRARLPALRRREASATASRAAAERALAELERRFRAAQDHTSVDEVAEARQAVFAARRTEIVARGATMEAALSLQGFEDER